MSTLKIPGVYVQEIPTFPPGVAEVNSAIPAFIGYTERTNYNEIDLTNEPVKIQSMLEFSRLFGESSPVKAKNVKLDLVETEKNATIESQYFMYDSLQLYFLNGGGPCYIVSIGDFKVGINQDHFLNALNALDLYDEPTIYLFPDAVLLPATNLKNVLPVALNKCSELMDRFCIFDLPQNKSAIDSLENIKDFRNTIGIANLKYGAAYTPWLETTLEKRIPAESIENIFDRLNEQNSILLEKEINGKMIKDVIAEYKAFLALLTALDADNAIKDIYKTFKESIPIYTTGGAKEDKNPFDDAEVFKPLKNFPTASSAAFKSVWDNTVLAKIASWKTELSGEIAKGATDAAKATIKRDFLNAMTQNNEMLKFQNVSGWMNTATKPNIDSYENFLIENIPYYSSLLKILKTKLTSLPPSGAMAGLYCKTDNERGVWKAPANISVNAVSGVTQLYTNSDLAELNVDPIAGKSVNVIRPITGYGTMVMGARTLAGNDAEWRYIPVRRLFIFIEENLKKSTSWAVFEPNDRLLWLKVRTQIENYLFELWRRGALAGAKPEHAYQVTCGLNSTMTPQDILEGKLYIEVKLAAVRPTEFIVLKFSHQLQKS